MRIDGSVWENPAKKELTGSIYITGNPDEPLERAARQLNLNYETIINNKNVKILRGIYRESHE